MPSPSRVAQQRDAVGADAERGGTPHRRLHRIAEHAPDRSGDLRRLGNEDVAIGQHVDPARMFQTGRKRIDLEPRRGHRLLPVGPALGRRHLERRDAALRLRRRHHRSAAPGRLRRDALQPAPLERSGADQRDYSRKNAGQAHVIPLFGGGRRSRLPCHDLERFPLDLTHLLRHARPTGSGLRPARLQACAGHPRLWFGKKGVDGRGKPGHDGVIQCERVPH